MAPPAKARKGRLSCQLLPVLGAFVTVMVLVCLMAYLNPGSPADHDSTAISDIPGDLASKSGIISGRLHVEKQARQELVDRIKVADQDAEAQLAKQSIQTALKPVNTVETLPPKEALPIAQQSSQANLILDLNAQVAASNYSFNHRRHMFFSKGMPILVDTSEKHCSLAKTSWCEGYWTQPWLIPRLAPRGDKACPSSPRGVECDGVGVCDRDFGTCLCRAGYMGPDCTQPFKRECANMNSTTKRDKDVFKGGWVHTRCAGICDDDIGMCYCPPETKYGHKVGPNALPGARPLQIGRPMYFCQPNTTKDGIHLKWSWNQHTYEDVLGPNGWCNNPDGGRNRCTCPRDGMGGHLCDTVQESVCANQCTGHGECMNGYCNCNLGWYGHDCARKRMGQVIEAGDELGSLPWIKGIVTQVPAAQDPPVRPARKRPFIYVYEMDPAYNSRMQQWRSDMGACIHREWMTNNMTDFVHYNAYALETVFHELMLTSEHRTFDPEEADYFYVPMYVSCLADVVGKAPRPFWPADENGSGMWGQRAYSMSMMNLAAQQWLSQTYPYWNRTGGANHIWVLTHDEAPCYQHEALWNSVLLSHWGRMDFPHKSLTSYQADSYSVDHKHSSISMGWINHTSGLHACHDPVKHLVVPVFKQPSHFRHSVYQGGAEGKRDILAFFRGDMGLKRGGCIYSRCIRQTLFKMYKAQKWKKTHNIQLGGTDETPGDYSELLMRSKFCLVIPGDGWSARYEDAMLHRCVPVIIMDNTLGPFEAIIDYTQFSIRLLEKDLDKLVETLLAVTPERLASLQAGLDKAWMRFRWSGIRLAQRSTADILLNNWRGRNITLSAGMEWTQTGDDDAFSTTMAWLYSRIPDTRGQPEGQRSAFRQSS